MAHHIVTVSNGIKDDLSRLSPRAGGKAQTIYNPVVDSDLVEKAKQPVSHPWLDDEDIPVILGVGRLTHEKNFDLLIRAFATVATARNVRLVLLGEGKHQEKLERLIHALGVEGRVDIHGFVGNPYPYMASASMLVLSSIFEGLPTVLIEALACGCPVVSTDCPSGPREILEGGKWGALVPVNDQEALAASIRKTLDVPHNPERLQHRAWDFSVERSVDHYLSLLFPGNTGVE
jgi:glycosyltransferase involved in cell wall biosynthesis